MNKLFTKIAGAALGLTMAIGVGVAVAGNIKEAAPVEASSSSSSAPTNATYSHVFSSGQLKVTSTGTAKLSNITWNTTCANTSAYLGWDATKGIQLGSGTSGKTIQSGYTISTAVSNFGTNKKVTKMAVGMSNASKGGYSGTFPNSDTWSGTATSVTYYTSTAMSITSGNITFSFQSTAQKAVYIKAIYVWYESAGNTKLSTPSPTYNDSTKQVTWNAISNATSYQVKVDSGSYATATSPYDVSGLSTGVQHTVYVVAKASGYTDSDPGSVQFTPTSPATYTSVSVSGGSLNGTEKGSAYIECTATAQGTNIPASPTFTWYVTETNTYGTTTTVTNKASIDSTGKVTFLDNATVYVWALAPDNTTHNTTGCAISASNLTDPKGSENNPYTVSEARDVATTTAVKKHVTGIIYEVSSYNSTYKSLTYWISDDGTGNSGNKDGLQIYSGKGLNGADFSGTSDLIVGSTVVVEGDLKIYSSTTYELDKNSVIKSISLPKELSSIAVKTAPTKTAYKANESFAPAGLVITATYSDTTTGDIAYSDSPGAFSFSPSIITAAGDVTITYGGKTCTQAVTLITVTNVTGVASAPTEVYKDGSINASDVTLNVTYSDSSVGTVTADSVTCDTSAIGQALATATYNAATGTKSATFNVEVVREPSYDYVVDNLVVADTGISSTAYDSWSGVTKISGAVYAGSTNENSNGGIGMRQDTNKDPSGIYVTTSPGVATKVELDWSTTTSRTIHIKGQDTPYTEINYASDVTGEEVGTITYNDTSYDLDKEYKYICIYVTGGAVGLNFIKITWKVEGAADPLTADPVLSTGSEAGVNVGKNIALGVTTTPVDSDEKLIVTSSNESYVTVSGSGRNYVIHGVAVGSATITVAGAKGVYSSSVLVTVSEATKTYEDKIMTPDDLGISSYEASDTTHSFDGVDFITKQVMKSGGFQFHKGDGHIYNDEPLYASNNIKSITLIMKSSNTVEPTVYEGSEAGATTTALDPKQTFAPSGVNTYLFSGDTQYFRIDASDSGTVVIEKIIIEMEDSSSSVLTKARSVASAILTGLNNLCGEGGSGVVTQSQWDAINSEIAALNLTDDDKLFLMNADRILLDNINQGGATIENAMAHYDACVTKFGFTPYAGITNAQSAPRINPVINVGSSTAIVPIVVVVSIMSAAAVGGYFMLRKRKEQ